MLVERCPQPTVEHRLQASRTTQHTTNTMMTRRATALCTEQKLRQALEELKHTQETCSQLLRERDESEIEIQKIIARNTQLKSELSQLHAQHVDVLQHQENLNETISCYDQQYSSYERTLQRITDLEKELSVANNQIAHYKELEQLQDTVHTENLYQELVGSPGGLSMLYQPLSTNKDNCPHVNNLNFDNSVQCSVETGNLKLSKNKFKKYVKVRKYILKTRKLINKEKTYYKNVNFIKERTQLLEKLDILNSIIKENRFTYEQNINSLNSRLKNLQQSLTKMTENYNNSKNQIAEYILALKLNEWGINWSGGGAQATCFGVTFGAPGQALPDLDLFFVSHQRRDLLEDYSFIVCAM
ncbi:hypothetical protein ACJJTC_013895 [Scirpophaga incertulas]